MQGIYTYFKDFLSGLLYLFWIVCILNGIWLVTNVIIKEINPASDPQVQKIEQLEKRLEVLEK